MKRINELFKPTKITLAGKSKIIHTENGKFVVKQKKKDIKSLYNYLSVRGFNNYPELIDEYDDNYVYQHLDGVNLPINQKAADMAGLLSLLHNKTAFFKPITADYIKGIYENVLNNILYLENYYHDLFEKISAEVMMSPAQYLLIRNSTKINANLSFTKRELEAWLTSATSHTKERVVHCHNNLSIDHYIKNADDYFISWDNYTIDSPVLDLINLYKNDYNKYDFSNFLEIYNYKFPLSDEEKKLLFIIISLPHEVRLDAGEFKNTKVVNELLIKIYKTEKLIRSYYAPQNPKE